MGSAHILLPLFALISPFFVWPIEQLLSYPYLIEEIVKLGFVLTVLALPSKIAQLKLLITVTLLFTLSETVFYLINFYQNQNAAGVILLRLALTYGLHLATVLLMWILANWSRYLLPLGLILAVLIHYFYNLFSGVLLGYPT